MRRRNLREVASTLLIPIAVVLGVVTITSAADEDVLARIAQAAGAGQHEQAIKLANAALNDQATLVDAYYLRGRSHFCLGHIKESVADFDKYVQLKPRAEPQQWERGIACYYAGEFEKGAKQFELYQTFHNNDVENSVWRFLCLVPDKGIEHARRTMLPIRDDPRVPMMDIYRLYRGEANVDDVLAAVDKDRPDDIEKAGRLFYAQLYIGLYYEALGEKELAKKYTIAAADEHRETKSINRYMWAVADVHARRYRSEAQQADKKPNIIFILADDLGYGDLGCYGQQRIHTPHVDQLAREGMRLTNFYAGSTVCAPSRCCLMTGLHQGHAFIRGNAKENLRPDDVTIAEVLKSAGYDTALIGKWGLGHEGSTGLPTRQGFDAFYGYLDQTHAHNYYPSYLIRQDKRLPLRNVVPNEGEFGEGRATEQVDYSHDLLTREALQYVREHQSGPFFLYLAFTIPHANNEADDFGMEVPDLGEYKDLDWPEPQKAHAAMISRMDRDIGRLMQELKDLQIDDDTIVFFSSDNGPHHEGGYEADFNDSNGPLRGIKRDLTEGGIRVPLIVRWPQRIADASTSDHAGAFWDVMPTLADLANAKAAVPQGIDGISFAPTLLGSGSQAEHDYLYWAFYEKKGGQALRMGKWKAIQQPYDTPIRLYDLEADIGEQNDVASSNPDVIARASDLMKEAHVPSDRWKFGEEKSLK